MKVFLDHLLNKAKNAGKCVTLFAQDSVFQKHLVSLGLTIDPQLTFDYVANHLRKQGKQAIGDNGCAYRGDGGTMCAAGCLIYGEDYSPRMEGTIVSDSEIDRSNPTCQLISSLVESYGHSVKVARHLQSVHDGCRDFRVLEKRLQDAASALGLAYTPPVKPEAEPCADSKS